VYFVSGGMRTWKRQSVEMAAVRVSGTVTNDDQCTYIKIEVLRGKTPMEFHSSQWKCVVWKLLTEAQFPAGLSAFMREG